MNSNKKNSNRPPAIIVGLDCMTGLQSARILAGHDVPVIAIAKNPGHFACHTKACDRVLFADTSSTEFIETLKVLAGELKQKAVLYPCTDMSVLQISRHRENLQQDYHVVLPDAPVVEMLMDKIAFIKFAQKEGLPIPSTFFLESRSDLDVALKSIAYPCILKPPMKSPKWEANTKHKVYKVAGEKELVALYDRCCDWADILMVQDCVEGTDANLYSCNCYFDSESEPLVTFIARKLRQWPPEVGTSCLGEEVRNDIVLEETVQLFRKVQYRGLGYVEMKKDERSGKHYIIEPNIGRPTGRSAISEAGDVALLYTKYCDVVGLPLPENRVQKYGGVKWIYWRRDLQSAWFYWRRGDLTFRQWVKSLRGKKGYAVWSSTDLRPFFADFFGKFAAVVFSRENKPGDSVKNNVNSVTNAKVVDSPAEVQSEAKV